MTEAREPILVIGATGQQGGAVARELLGRGYPVHALTRDPTGSAARRLAERGATVVGADLDAPASVEAAMEGVGAVFAMLTHLPPEGTDGELRRGLTVAEAAGAAGARHLVYSSVDGAERRSGVPHFESKWAVELRLAEIGVPTTVLRPTMLMENFAAHARPALVDGGLVVRMPRREDAPVQMIACADIGFFAAEAFERPGEHIGQAVPLAGDELTGPEIADTFRSSTKLPAVYIQQPLAELRAFSQDAAVMWQFLEDDGYRNADVAALRERHPGMRRLGDWLTESAWRAIAVS